MASKTMSKTDVVGYVDGYVLVVPQDQVSRYKKMAREGGDIWIKHGALAVRECQGDDLNPDTSGQPIQLFQKLVDLKPGETVWFSYIEYRSKRHRDQVNKAVKKEMEAYMQEHPEEMQNMPFDLQRMSFGGFKVAVGVTR